MSRKICVVTGSRAEYGLLRWVMGEIQSAPDLELQVIATGMHLSPEFGLTYCEIENDGFKIDRKLELLLSSDSPTGVSKSVGLGLIGFGDILKELAPDMVLVLGDRFEIFAAVTSAMLLRIPVAHLHGGELTEGLIDESIRNSLTKMSHLHFVAAEEYKRRVIQLGEQPDRVFLVGGMGIDNIKNLTLLDQASLEESMGFEFGKRNLLVTFHPVTLENSTSESQMRELLSALDELENTRLIFTMPNADTDGRILFEVIKEYVVQNSNACAFTSLGYLRYLSCLQFVDGAVGNSSSGLIEVPSFKKGTINIGDRQRGRIKADSVIDCQPNKVSILDAIDKLYSEAFQNMLTTVTNPYGDGGAAKRVVEVLRQVSLGDILKKRFYDAETS